MPYFDHSWTAVAIMWGVSKESRNTWTQNAEYYKSVLDSKKHKFVIQAEDIRLLKKFPLDLFELELIISESPQIPPVIKFLKQNPLRIHKIRLNIKHTFNSKDEAQFYNLLS